MTAKDPETGPMRYAFHLCVQLLRRRQNLTVQELAKRSDIDPEELATMERNAAYRPSPRTLHKLSLFYQIPERQMLALAGAIKDVPEDLRQQASRFAAQSETFAKLTEEEKRALDEFVKVLRASP